MRAASENLVPVTLELGGKSPVIVERGTSLEDTAYRIAHGKLANGGQTCVAPDYVLVHEDEVEAFTAAFEQAVGRLYPSIATNPDYTWIINDHHFARLTGLVDRCRRQRRADDRDRRRNLRAPQARSRGCSCRSCCSASPTRCR